VDVVILLVFVSLILVAAALLFFFSRLSGGDFDHADRLSLLPLQDEPDSTGSLRARAPTRPAGPPPAAATAGNNPDPPKPEDDAGHASQ
jgi:hypothetical protein